MSSMSLHRQATLWMGGVIVLGGLSLLALAVSAALSGIWSAAVFIGLCGVALISTVVLVLFRFRYNPSSFPRS